MSESDWKKNNLATIFPELPKVESILDIGCGLALKSKYIPASIRVGVDIYPEYFKHIDATVPYVVMKYDARKLYEVFMPGSFDLVIATDVIEHLKKDDALFAIKQWERLAKKAIILETPEGFIPQNIDILGWGGDKYQTHRSGWEKRDLERLGYTVKVRDYKMEDIKRHNKITVPRDIKLMDAIKIL